LSFLLLLLQLFFAKVLRSANEDDVKALLDCDVADNTPCLAFSQ
jgi:hypothetical protein